MIVVRIYAVLVGCIVAWPFVAVAIESLDAACWSVRIWLRERRRD